MDAEEFPRQSEWRRRYLAQLSLERANLWWAIVGLTAEHLTTWPVWDDWCVKDILAHLSFWDSLAADRVQRAIEGRLDRAPHSQTSTAALNAHRQKLHTLLTLDAAMAMCLKERQGFLNALSAATDSLLETSAPWAGDIVPLQRIVDWRILHDQRHTADLIVWRDRLALPGVDIGPVSVLLACFRATRRALRALIERIPPDERNARPVWGAQTLRDALAQRTSWNALALHELESLADERQAGVTRSEAVRTAQPTPPWADVWAAFITTQAALSTRIAALNEATLARPIISAENQPPTLYAWLLAGIAHERELAARLQAYWPV